MATRPSPARLSTRKRIVIRALHHGADLNVGNANRAEPAAPFQAVRFPTLRAHVDRVFLAEVGQRGDRSPF